MTRRPPPASQPAPRSDATPHCKHFGTCGGCSLLDQPIAWQLHDKVAATEALLAPVLGGLRIEYDTPPQAPRHFRTRLLYPVRADRNGIPMVGIYEFHSHHVVRIEECRTQDVWLTELGLVMERALRELRLQPYDPRSKRGTVKAVAARLAGGTGEVVASIITRPGAFSQGQAFADAVLKGAAALPQIRHERELVGVVHGISDRDDEFLLADRNLPLRGRDHVIDRRDGLQFRISAGSFYQVHVSAPTLLYGPGLKMCGDVRDQRVVDGYGGVGCFGLRLAKAGAAKVTIVEDNAAACRDATHNIAANALTNVDVLEAQFTNAKFANGPDLLVVDPPRSGLGEAGVKRVLAAKPKRLLYVACAADSLARDLTSLTAKGFKLVTVRLCDLFPHTEHVELLALLQRA